MVRPLPAAHRGPVICVLDPHQAGQLYAVASLQLVRELVAGEPGNLGAESALASLRSAIAHDTGRVLEDLVANARQARFSTETGGA